MLLVCERDFDWQLLSGCQRRGRSVRALVGGDGSGHGHGCGCGCEREEDGCPREERSGARSCPHRLAGE